MGEKFCEMCEFIIDRNLCRDNFIQINVLSFKNIWRINYFLDHTFLIFVSNFCLLDSLINLLDKNTMMKK